MCGCNSNVKYKNNTNADVQVYEVPPPVRKVGLSCDSFGNNCNIVESLTFRTSEAVANGSSAALSATRTSIATSGFPKAAFSVGVAAQSLSAVGLHQLAVEFAALADALDGGKRSLIETNVKRASKKKAKKTVKKLVTKK